MITFNLAEMFVVHCQLRLAVQEVLNAKHSQPLSLKFIKVALRALNPPEIINLDTCVNYHFTKQSARCGRRAYA
jgi:hypothetical protein